MGCLFFAHDHEIGKIYSDTLPGCTRTDYIESQNAKCMSLLNSNSYAYHSIVCKTNHKRVFRQIKIMQSFIHYFIRREGITLTTYMVFIIIYCITL